MLKDLDLVNNNSILLYLGSADSPAEPVAVIENDSHAADLPMDSNLPESSIQTEEYVCTYVLMKIFSVIIINYWCKTLKTVDCLHLFILIWCKQSSVDVLPAKCIIFKCNSKAHLPT